MKFSPKKLKVMVFGGLCVVIVATVCWLSFGSHKAVADVSDMSSNSASAVQSDYAGSTNSTDREDSADSSKPLTDYDYTVAPQHIGERARIHGTITNVFASKSGTTFLDFCAKSKNCPFSAVIFSDDLKKFGDASKLKGKHVITGVIKSYQSKAEIILSDPSQVI
jgi:hypothetical protein